MKIITAPTEPLLDIRCFLGEGPLYEHETDTLHFIDIARGEVHHLELASMKHEVDFYEGHPSCIRLRENGQGFIAAVDRGFAYLPRRSLGSTATSPAKLTYHTLLDERAHPKNKMHNEGETDPWGRFVAGTKPARGEPMEGKLEETLWRIEGAREGHVEHITGGMGLPNGMGWSVDGTKFYVTDSAKCGLTRSHFDLSTGVLSEPEPFISCPEGPSPGLAKTFPDGLCVDAADQIYSAHFGGSKIVRYDSTGHANLEIRFENAYHITACELGGKDGSTLFVTTASLEESGEHDQPELRDRFDKSGAVWAIDLSQEGAKAKERYKFKG
ncbi:hypothetical protein JCM10212_006445 [Sporobolomyces blumeae]